MGLLFSKKHILIVDDEQDILENLSKVLERAGYKVTTLKDGDGVMNACMQNKPDLIILDIVMPGISGPEVAMKLAEDVNFKDIPIIFLTGLFSKEEEGKMDNSMPHRTIISKPCDTKTILDTIKEKLG